uniref:Methyltransferase type 11 n=1 Tax=mine drainage metagenome TaxID=410659 RepID=E6Q4Y4_9ZZZZ
MRAAHPLARQLIARLPRAARVLEIGHGSGRNHRALEAAGLEVLHFDAVLTPTERAAAALSTHALLHGSPAEIAALLAQIACGLVGGAPFFATFGSTRDARFGEGTQLGPATFAPTDGDERGIAHSYYDEAGLRSALDERFAIEELREVEVDAIAGGWAHASAPLRGAVHWFVVGHRRFSRAE